MATTPTTPLGCPKCGRRFPLDARFCDACQMPLVYLGETEQAPITDAHGRARKVKAQFTHGDLVKVATARNLAEAELIQGILIEEGIPSMLKRTRGFDVPDFLAAGPRDVMVTASGLEHARAQLDELGLEPRSAAEADELSGHGPDEIDRGHAFRLFAWILIALAIGSALLGIVYALTT